MLDLASSSVLGIRRPLPPRNEKQQQVRSGESLLRNVVVGSAW